ncbi:MAG: hypothetical protein KGH54_02215 [Candidatus Micrarchaeota archaeon]|nr:hypothetical protein [Candidatus Micrarchaeota archaeon]
MSEETIFMRLFGTSPTVKVLDFLLTAREFDYSKKEIAENSVVSYNTLNSIWSELLGNKLIVKTRRIGKQDLFRLNQENKEVMLLVKFFDSLLKESIDSVGKVKIKQTA